MPDGSSPSRNAAPLPRVVPPEPLSGAGDECGPVADASEATFQFVESPIFETLFSMQALLLDWYDEPWVEQARERMGVAYLRELRNTLGPFRMGVDLFELAVPEAADQEVAGFLDRLRSMPEAEFSYYCLGRLIPMKGGKLSIDPDELRNLFENYGVYTHYLERLTQVDWQTRGPEYQRSLADLIESFWEHYFQHQYPHLEVPRTVSVAKNEAYGQQHGVAELYRLITNRETLHLLLNQDERLRQVSFVPVVNLAQPFFVYSGHEDITVVYHASRTKDRLDELSEREKSIIAISRALGDKTRFQIVKLLFQYHHALNGQNIADKVGVSKSVVSKHLQQLKEAKIVRETSPDKRNNIYSIEMGTLRDLSPGLLEVLRG